MATRKLRALQIIADAPKQPGALQGASSTAEFYFKNSDAVETVVAVPIAKIKNRPFTVRAGGRIQGAAGTTPDLQVQIDAGNSGTAGSNTTIASSGSIVLDNDTTVMTWYLEAQLMLGTVNSKLQGRFSGWVNNTAVAATVLTESVEDLVAGGVLFFKATGQCSESIAAHGAYLDFLEVICDDVTV